MSTRVVLKDVGKTFRTRSGEVHALHGVNLTVEPGEFVCILGPSGCGKTTLLHLVGGFELPTTGTVEVDGEPVWGPDPRRIFVFQEYGIFPWATVWENVALGLRKRPKAEQDEIVGRYVELVGLKGFERSYPAELSGGMKQRVAVARALAVSPGLLLMDEPFGALDAITRGEMRRELREIWERTGMTVLFVTHDVDEALKLGQRVLLLTSHPGAIVDNFPAYDSLRGESGASTGTESLREHLMARLRTSRV